MKINGKPVVDPKRRIVLVVTPNDVGRGTAKRADSCATAKACVRQLGALSAKVHATRTYIEYADKVERYMTPASLRVETISFDRGHRFVPGIYHLAPLPPSMRGTRKDRLHKAPQKGRPGVPAPKRSHRSAPHQTMGVRAHSAGWSNQ